ncbi:hypothetical protein ACFSBZ_09775 [Amnibacterium flavum]|uniref:Tfp pilus assembly protein PilO n=1 Tax=Amnibacterium flavum TaxID=2173173 RepID=A0A2V1HRB0_9MICO|nr:hypothetical protein [Amnibacterium flavum]PVZ95143.1 hypothetical protein DDQ50_01010 [Amnibacterium flavum]
MNSTRLWMMGGALAIIGVLAGGWFLGVSPLISAAAASDMELSSVEQANASQQARIDTLAEASENLPELQKDLSALSAAIPQTSGLSDFVGELSNLADTTGVLVSSLTVNDALLLSDAAAQAAAAAPAPVETEAPAEGEAATDGAAATDAAEASTAPLPVTVDVPGMIAIPVQLSASGSLDALQAFVAAMQDSSRFASISGMVFSQDTSTRSFRLDLTAAIYVLPLS